jgi:ABC-2 type transport system ATP-binding protein
VNESATVAIRTNGLAKSYEEIQALKPLDMTVAKHSIFGFLGPNGAGKTTTIKLLLGLARPTGGSATVFGRDIVRDSIAIRRRVGYLAQDPRYYEKMTARQTLRFKADFYYSGPKTGIERRVDELIDMVDLADKADRPIRGFSGGERQRLGIAQALVNSPDLLVLDEPAASLDPMGRRDVLDIMVRLRETTTIFYSTHILADVQRVSDVVGILNKGELVAQAPIKQLLAGSGGVAYSVVVKGAADAVRKQIAAEPWVTDIEITPGEGQVTWTITVDDEAAAEAKLLRMILADEHTTVSEFGRRQYDLEEVFMSVVEGGNGNG